MDFYLDYPITQNKGEVISLSWTKGYRSVNAEYQGEMLFENKSFAQLQKGIVVQHPYLGKIEVKFSKQKLILNVIVNGFHSPINKDHPIHKIKSYSTYFWIVFGGTCLIFLSDLVVATSSPNLLVILIGPVFTLLALFTYFFSAYQLRKAKASFFWIGFSMFTFRTLFIVALTFAGVLTFDPISIMINFLVKGGFLLAFILAIPTILSYQKHEKYIFQENDDTILDQK